jgi:hypothetical protein
VKFTILPDNIGAFILFEDETTSLSGCCGGTAGSIRPAIRPVQNGYIGVDTLFIFSDSIPLTPLASTADTLALLPTPYGGGEIFTSSFRFYW